MKKKLEMSRKIAVIITAAALCLTGCGTEGANQTDDFVSSENVPGMIKVESSASESKEESTEADNETAVQGSQVKEQEPAAGEVEGSSAQADIDVAKVLEEAESSAAALQKKLQEDASLTQADMNTLSGEIYQVWDDALNELWNALKDSLDEETMENLLEEQRAWITEKEAEVKQAGEAVGGGSLAPLVANQRAVNLTRVRVYELAGYLGYEGTLITFTVEGMEEIIPATVFEGLHYTIAIPNEGWEMISSECWASDANGEVQFWITDYAGENANSVCEKLAGNGYAKSESDAYHLSREDEDGMVWNVRLFAEDGETIGVFYCYPSEAAEGFGIRIPVIIDTFAWK